MENLHFGSFRKLWLIPLVAAVLAVLFIMSTEVALAHHPEIEAEAVCDPASGEVVINYTATAWVGFNNDPINSRTHGHIEVFFDDVMVDVGAFNEGNDFMFSGSEPAPASAGPGDTVKVLVRAIGDWGNGVGSDNPGDERHTDVIIPQEPCVEPDIHLEKLIQVVPVPVDDVCDVLGKPQILTMLYTGGNTQDHAQEIPKKADVTGDAPLGPVRIRVTNKKDPFDSKAKVYIGELAVAHLAEFDINADAIGKDNLESTTYVFIYPPDGGPLSSLEPLQVVKFHTSCSQFLSIGDQFGGVQLVRFENANGVAPPVPGPIDPPVDADTEAEAVMAMIGDKVIWTYEVTNPGTVPLTITDLTDDNGTPDPDTGNDFQPDPILALDGIHNVGDTGPGGVPDGLLDPDETWLYMFMAQVEEFGLHTNIAKVTGTFEAFVVMDDDPSNYKVDVPTVDQCVDGQGKPRKLTMLYTGEWGNDSTLHSQDPSKVQVEGNPLFEDPVRIIVASKEDPNDSKAKIYLNMVLDLVDVSVDGTFMFDSLDATKQGVPDPKSRLSSNTYILVYDLDGELLQTVKFHTSCSQPLFLGDQFGSLVLVGYIGENAP